MHNKTKKQGTKVSGNQSSPAKADNVYYDNGSADKASNKKTQIKPALKYGIIGFALAVLLFALIPGGQSNVDTNIISPAAQTDTSSAAVIIAESDVTEEPIEELDDNVLEPVIDVEDSVDWSQITVTQKTETLEYSKKTTDPLKLISCDDEDVYIDTNDKIDLSDTGTQKVTYTLTKDGVTKDVELTFTVKDTKKPKIVLNKEKVVITAGDDFDPLDNIKSVKDPVDGKLKYTSADLPGKGEYTFTKDYKTDKKGTYEISVVAKDKHGKIRTKTFKLKVKAAENVAANVSAPVDEGEDYILNTNTHKFHYPWCRSVGQMAEHNKWAVHMTREEVLARGYVPCKNCNP